jgi:hypothetical protein
MQGKIQQTSETSAGMHTCKEQPAMIKLTIIYKQRRMIAG